MLCNQQRRRRFYRCTWSMLRSENPNSMGHRSTRWLVVAGAVAVPGGISTLTSFSSLFPLRRWRHGSGDWCWWPRRNSKSGVRVAPFHWAAGHRATQNSPLPRRIRASDCPALKIHKPSNYTSIYTSGHDYLNKERASRLMNTHWNTVWSNRQS